MLKKLGMKILMPRCCEERLEIRLDEEQLDWDALKKAIALSWIIQAVIVLVVYVKYLLVS